MRRFWTEDKLVWLKNNKNKFQDRKDILDIFNEIFKTNVTRKQLQSASDYYNLKLNYDNSYRLKNLNYGWLCLRDSLVKNVGDEVKARGANRIYIKVSNSKDKSKKYQEKQRYLYEKYHNVKLTRNELIIFLDGDKNNFSKDNLYKINRYINNYMATQKLYKKNKHINLSRIKFCEWKQLLKTVFLND